MSIVESKMTQETAFFSWLCYQRALIQLAESRCKKFSLLLEINMEF